MKFTQAKNGLSYLSFPETKLSEVKHGFFTRNGGVSPHPFDSLNLSISTGDSRENVRMNRDLLFNAIDRSSGTMFDVWQVHSDTIICSDKPRGNNELPTKADAIFTNNPHVTLLMRFADCVPILIYDPIRKVVGIIHAGWQGTVKQIAKKAIGRLTEEYGCNPGDIQAVIGPSIGAHHYQIGEDVYKHAAPLFEKIEGVIEKVMDGHVTFNLPMANEVLLKQAGVRSVFQSRICTACDTEKWYSHRAENGKTGRFAASIGLHE